jgi:hypothetical protein
MLAVTKRQARKQPTNQPTNQPTGRTNERLNERMNEQMSEKINKAEWQETNGTEPSRTEQDSQQTEPK